MFVPVKGDTGAVLPWEYLEAAAGSYQVGQLLTVTEGKLAALEGVESGIPGYLCMATKDAAEGDTLPVTRISRDVVYETVLAAQMEEAAVGKKISAAANGLDPDSTAGSFELVWLAGTEAGDAVRGRWTDADAAE